ncbi:MAG: hypothetical protein K1X67_16775 [Fimbriimonadaceae bacterium]|nr:hypothetical protein [Fimbriimonadaceae bacterium]
MKLNLLPTHVSKSGQAKTATIVSLLMVVLSIAAAVFMLTSSKKALADAKQKAMDVKPQADQAVEIAKMADKLINGQPPYTVPAPLIARNTSLANAMLDHSKVYPDLYREVLQYIPDFFRLTSISAQPSNAQVAQVNMTGVIRSFQEYADLMIALLRMPGAASVTRQGYNLNDMYVPNLITEDQIGIPIRRDQERLSSNSIERLQQLIAGANANTTTSFQNLNGFGTDEDLTKGAMNGWSEITVTMLVVGKNLQTPNPRETLKRVPEGSTPAPNTGGGGGGFNPGPGAPPPPGGSNPPNRPGRGEDDL